MENIEILEIITPSNLGKHRDNRDNYPPPTLENIEILEIISPFTHRKNRETG
jgi:hypothetical protein